MKKLPEWTYPLYRKSDKLAFNFLVRLGAGSIRPVVTGSREEISRFVKLLVITQKTEHYRAFRDIILWQVRSKKIINTPLLISRGDKFKIRKGVDRSWTVFKQDRRLCLLLDRLVAKKIDYLGSGQEVRRFIAEFLLSQLLQDWRGPLMMVIMESLKSKKINLKKINKLLSYWDFTKKFK